MEWLFEIVIIVAPIILGVLLSTTKITEIVKLAAWAICIGISIIAASWSIKKRVSDRKKAKQEDYNRRLLERHELYHQGQPLFGEENDPGSED